MTDDTSMTPPLPQDEESRPARLLSVRNLHVSFPSQTGLFRDSHDRRRVLRGISLHLDTGDSLGIVGESGCGKSTLARAILGLIPVDEGDITICGTSILGLSEPEMRPLRRRLGFVFQDPAGSLNPRLRVRDIVREPILVHQTHDPGIQEERVEDLLSLCGLPRDAGTRYPHEFSGGQRQRIAIARALAAEPAILICDEPTSSLDVPMQAAILHLLDDLRQDLGVATLLISHDIAVIEHFCPRIAVMDAGKIVETGDRDQVINAPTHPCTQRLLASIPSIDPEYPALSIHDRSALL